MLYHHQQDSLENVNIVDQPENEAIVEELQRLFDRGEEIFSRSNVIDGDLLGCLVGRCVCHVVVAPVWVTLQEAHNWASDEMILWIAEGRRIRSRNCDTPA